MGVKKPKEQEKKLKQPQATQRAEDPHPVIPEALDARTDDKVWTVRKADTLSGSTNLSTRTMIVPQDSGPEADSVRVHEMLHARMTPPNLMSTGNQKHGVTVDSLQACEDMRINYTAERHGITEIHDTPVTTEQVEQIITKLAAAAKAVERGPSLYNDQASRLYHRAACVAAALVKTQHEQFAREVLHNHVPRDVYYRYHFAVGEMNYSQWTGDGNKSPAATIRAGRHLDQILERHMKVDGEVRRPGGDPSNTEKMQTPDDIDGPDTEAMIAALRVYDPELKITARKRTRAFKKTSDAGTLWRPTEAMRLDGTGLPFRRKLKSPHGCAILIDSSGSMGFGHEQLAEIIALVPGALVMLHASRSFGSGEKGTFATVGKDGKVVDEETLEYTRNEKLGGGNANDAGAVLLAGKLANKHKVRGPRFWVTDEGWGDLQGIIRRGNVHKVCKLAAKQAKFEIVESIEQIWANGPTREMLRLEEGYTPEQIREDELINQAILDSENTRRKMHRERNRIDPPA